MNSSPIGQPLSLHVLLVEDTIASQKIVQRILNQRSHVVDVAQDGQEAVEMFCYKPYDIVLMDVQMPIMDGLQATCKIRQYEAQRRPRVPIVALTTLVMPGDRQRCLAAGMDAYLGKPFKTKELIDLIETLSAHPTDGLVAPATVEDEPLPPVASGGILSSGDRRVFDVDSTLKRLANDRDLLNSLIDFFLEDSPELMERLRQSLAQHDLPTATRTAHSVKGLASNFDAADVVAAAAVMEKSGGLGDLETTLQNMPILEQAISTLEEQLAAYRAEQRVG